MSARKSNPSAQKFHVGQVCALVLDKQSGWPSYNGRLCTIAAPLRRMSLWCSNEDGSASALKHGEYRYEVDVAGHGTLRVHEYQLRAIYDGEAVSTWAGFAKIAGIRPDRDRVHVGETLTREKS